MRTPLNRPSIPQFSYFPYEAPSTNCVATIGNFDGCHLGHQALLQNNQKLAEKFACSDVVLTFDPHPHTFFHPETPAKYLLTPQRKVRALKEMGVKKHYVLNFDHDLNQTDHGIFYKNFLIETLRIQALTIGSDFHFGHLRKGDVPWLIQHGNLDKVQVDVIEPIQFDMQAVSSTRIRKLLTEQGDVSLATALLSHLYSMEGTLVPGKQMGRKLGFPTLNLNAPTQTVPKDGVYSGYVWIEGLSSQVEAPIIQIDKRKLFPAAISIGTRPSFQNDPTQLNIEAHILNDFSTHKELYQVRCAFYFVKRLRDMMTFSNIEDLKKQMTADLDVARASLL